MNNVMRAAVIRSYAEEIFGKNVIEVSFPLKGYSGYKVMSGIVKRNYIKSKNYFHNFYDFFTSPL